MEDFQGFNHRRHQSASQVVILPPASVNLRNNRSQTGSPFGHHLSVTSKLPLTLACSFIRTSHLSTASHGLRKRYPRSGHSSDSTMTDVNTGVEEMEHRRFVRWGEGLTSKTWTIRVARAGKDGRWTEEGIFLAGVSRKSITIVFAVW